MQDLSTIVFDAVRRANGADAEPATPIRDAVRGYIRHLRDLGRSPRHLSDVQKHCRRICKAAGMETIGDLAEARVIEGIGVVRRARRGRQGAKQLSSWTVQHYRNSIRGFARWLFESKKLGAHRLQSLPTFRREGNSRPRRELSIADVERLLVAAEQGTRIESISGPDRAWLYRVALATGFRRNELSTLTPESFSFTQHGAFVYVAAKHSKRRQDEKQPIPLAAAEPLAAWLKTRPKGEYIWPLTPASGAPQRKTSLMLRLDLAAAGIPYQTADGFADFHALRVAYCSWLVRAGANPKALQAAARHSSIKLTMDVYTKIRSDEVVDAVAKLPTPGGP